MTVVTDSVKVLRITRLFTCRATHEPTSQDAYTICHRGRNEYPGTTAELYGGVIVEGIQ